MNRGRANQKAKKTSKGKTGANKTDVSLALSKQEKNGHVVQNDLGELGKNFADVCKKNPQMAQAILSFANDELVPRLEAVKSAMPSPPSAKTYRSILDDALYQGIKSP